MITEELANRTIPRPVKGVQRVLKKYRLNNILDLCHSAFKSDHHRMREFAKQIPATKRGLEDLFDFVDRYFLYETDPDRVQAVQSPDVMWHNKPRYGDCKSYTEFIACTTFNMGLKTQMILADYGDPLVKHIYPVVYLPTGERVVLDVVYTKETGAGFNKEKKPMQVKTLNLDPGLYKIGSTQHQAAETIAQLESHLSDIPDDIIGVGPGDVTAMTSGELDRFLMTERLATYADHATDEGLKRQYKAGITAIRSGSTTSVGSVLTTEFRNRFQKFLDQTAKNTKPAFGDIKLKIISDPSVTGIGKFFKKVGKAFKRLFSKFMNWVFKGTGKKMAPFFLFLFLKKKSSAEIRRRFAKQEKLFNWIAKIGKFDKSKLKSLMHNEIVKQTGKTPSQLLNGAANASVSGASVGAIGAFVGIAIKAIGMVIQVIKKIKKLFKPKGGSPSADKADVSDLTLIANAEAANKPRITVTTKPNTTATNPGTGNRYLPIVNKKVADEPKPDSGGGSGMAIAMGLGILGLIVVAK